jgi:hypothetical protein
LLNINDVVEMAEWFFDRKVYWRQGGQNFREKKMAICFIYSFFFSSTFFFQGRELESKRD